MKQGPLKGRNEDRSDYFRSAFGKVLLALEQKLSRAEIAAAMEVDPSLLTHIANGKRHPTPAFVGRLCRLPQVTPEAALGLITAHLRDVAEEALPASGQLALSRLDVRLKHRRSA